MSSEIWKQQFHLIFLSVSSNLGYEKDPGRDSATHKFKMVTVNLKYIYLYPKGVGLESKLMNFSLRNLLDHSYLLCFLAILNCA